MRALFGRRRSTSQVTTVAVAPVRSAAPPTGPIGYATGWAPMGVRPASDQIGAFAGTQLTQRAANVVELQKAQGVEGLSAGWYVPANLSSSTGFQITMHAGNPAEVQRIVGGSTGQLGPITARAMRANVTAQAVRQSGLSAVQWAAALSPLSGT